MILKFVKNVKVNVVMRQQNFKWIIKSINILGNNGLIFHEISIKCFNVNILD